MGRTEDQEGRENCRRERDRKKKLRVRCREIERKRENAGNAENTRRVYSVIKKENRERNFPRRGDERRIGNSGLQRDREHEKGGSGRTNSKIEQETKSHKIRKRKSWI